MGYAYGLGHKTHIRSVCFILETVVGRARVRCF
jgi:hypothetical protein